jgi:hypothetical protein
MVRSMVRWTALGLVFGLLAATNVDAQQQPPRVFASDAGLVLNFVKADKTADFEAVMQKLKEALQKSDKPQRKEQAATWKVFKSPDPAAGGNVLYVFVIDPAVKGADYNVIQLLIEGFTNAEVQTLYTQYAGALASQTIVNLTLTAALGK